MVKRNSPVKLSATSESTSTRPKGVSHRPLLIMRLSLSGCIWCPNIRQVSGSLPGVKHLMTLQAIFPEKVQPAWGTIPPTAVVGSPGQGRFTPENSSMALRQEDSLPGYQEPARSALLTSIQLTPFPMLDFGLRIWSVLKNLWHHSRNPISSPGIIEKLPDLVFRVLD